MGMTKTMTPKTEAALVSIAVALTATETGELAEHELEALKGVGLPQIKALTARGILEARDGAFIPTTGPYAGQYTATKIYSVA